MSLYNLRGHDPTRVISRGMNLVILYYIYIKVSGVRRGWYGYGFLFFLLASQNHLFFEAPNPSVVINNFEGFHCEGAFPCKKKVQVRLSDGPVFQTNIRETGTIYSYNVVLDTSLASPIGFWKFWIQACFTCQQKVKISEAL